MARLARRMSLAALAGASVLALGEAASAQQPFQCPRRGGDLIFALEARIPMLDPHATGAAATRNVTMRQ